MQKHAFKSSSYSFTHNFSCITDIIISVDPSNWMRHIQLQSINHLNDNKYNNLNHPSPALNMNKCIPNKIQWTRLQMTHDEIIKMKRINKKKKLLQFRSIRVCYFFSPICFLCACVFYNFISVLLCGVTRSMCVFNIYFWWGREIILLIQRINKNKYKFITSNFS